MKHIKKSHQYNGEITLYPLKYLLFGVLAPDVQNLVDDPSNLANYWQLIPFVHLSVTLDEKEVICVARDLLSKNKDHFAPLHVVHLSPSLRGYVTQSTSTASYPLLSLSPTCSPKRHHPLSESALSDYEQNEDERMKKSRTKEEQRVRKSNLERKMISLYIDCTE
jgi:hypothetical protein